MSVKLSVLLLLLQYYTLINADLGSFLPRTFDDSTEVQTPKHEADKLDDMSIEDGRRPWKECKTKPVRCPVCHKKPKESLVHTTKYARALSEFLKTPMSRGRSIDLRPFMRMFDFSTRDEARILLTLPISTIIDDYVENIKPKLSRSQKRHKKKRRPQYHSRNLYTSSNEDNLHPKHLMSALQLEDSYDDDADPVSMLMDDAENPEEIAK